MTRSARPLDDDSVRRLSGILRASESPELPVHPDYDIVAMLARGGMGTIYRAIDRKLDRPVAMKVLEESRTPWITRFEREAIITARLQHPNIVPVHDYGELEDGRRFYTMKLVEGRPLSQVIREAHAPATLDPSLSALLRFLCQVCDAMDHAHSQGVIHRDLKPSNIMIGDFNQVWLLDWGLVRRVTADEADREASPPARTPLIDSSASRAGEVIGTPAYMAPEQAGEARREVSAAIDVYAIGAVLLEVLTGRPPYAGEPPDRIIGHLRSGVTPELRTGAWAIPRPLASVARRAMDPDPAARYRSAGSLAEDVRRWMDGLPVAAHRESWHERLWRLARRFRVAIAVVLCYLVIRMIVLLALGR